MGQARRRSRRRSRRRRRPSAGHIECVRRSTGEWRCLRQIHGISLCDRVHNEVIRGRCQQQPTSDQQIQQRRLRWFGYVCRMDTARLPHQLLWRQRPAKWKDQRNVPNKTWVKQIEDDHKMHRLDLGQTKASAMDRQAWKNMVQEIQHPTAPSAAYWFRSHTHVHPPGIYQRRRNAIVLGYGSPI